MRFVSRVTSIGIANPIIGDKPNRRAIADSRLAWRGGGSAARTGPHARGAHHVGARVGGPLALARGGRGWRRGGGGSLRRKRRPRRPRRRRRPAGSSRASTRSPGCRRAPRSPRRLWGRLLRCGDLMARLGPRAPYRRRIRYIHRLGPAQPAARRRRSRPASGCPRSPRWRRTAPSWPPR